MSTHDDMRAALADVAEKTTRVCDHLRRTRRDIIDHNGPMTDGDIAEIRLTLATSADCLAQAAQIATLAAEAPESTRGVEYFFDSLTMYVQGGLRPGSFLTAVLANNLTRAVSYADPESRVLIPDLVTYCVEHLPDDCWGTPSLVDAWIAKGGSERHRKWVAR